MSKRAWHKAGPVLFSVPLLRAADRVPVEPAVDGLIMERHGHGSRQAFWFAIRPRRTMVGVRHRAATVVRGSARNIRARRIRPESTFDMDDERHAIRRDVENGSAGLIARRRHVNHARRRIDHTEGNCRAVGRCVDTVQLATEGISTIDGWRSLVGTADDETG